ncbi:MAG: hypothetical protein AUJ72_04440 [Candidatus Omnitrophica bacterium CG1_02_46_14]|nr:MAG: hypothetical protein AUJ72_04440 [Candidatus Omnitrophica bacterium CG1_02_46_14]
MTGSSVRPLDYARNGRHVYDAIIIGAGFAGLSTAYHLAKKGLKNIVVLEHEKKLGSHASGRNAGMIRQAISDPILGKLAAEGRRTLSLCEKKGWKGTRLALNGSLLLARDKEIDQLKKIAKVLKNEKIPAQWFNQKKASRLVSLLDGGDFKRALFCKSDAMIDIDRLIKGFYQALKTRRVQVLMGHGARSIRKEKNLFYVTTAGNKALWARRLVDAGGAWAGAVARKAHASLIVLKAYRRHLLTANPSRPFDASWPFVWDLSRDFYFRPEKGVLLLSACDTQEIKDTQKTVKKETVDPHIKNVLFGKLKGFSDKFESISIRSVKSGLRTMSPDSRFVIGEDPKLKGFFWVAALGGHGMTTSFAVGDLASDLILGRKREKKLVNALSPKRFIKTDNC